MTKPELLMFGDNFVKTLQSTIHEQQTGDSRLTLNYEIDTPKTKTCTPI